jgi:hypothetical protein
MRYKQINHKGEYTMSGIFAEVQAEMQAEADKLKYDSQHITIAMFTKVVNLYFMHALKELIEEGKVFQMIKKFGSLLVVQSMCVRYNPTKTFFVTENGQVIRKTQKIELVNGRIPHLFWDVGKRWRTFKFILAPKFKRQIHENFKAGFPYDVMDLKKYGKLATTTYIQKRR